MALAQPITTGGTPKPEPKRRPQPPPKNHHPKSGTHKTVSAVPAQLQAAAHAYLNLSNICSYLASAPLFQGGGSVEYLTLNLDSAKPQVEQLWTDGVYDITGVLLSGAAAFADAAIELTERAGGFVSADS